MRFTTNSGAVIDGIELVLLGQDIAHRLLDARVIVGLVVEPDGVQVVGVLEVAHGGEGDVHDAIHVVVTFLHLGGQDADDLEADAVNADVLAQCVAPGKQLVFGSDPMTATRARWIWSSGL